jgi:hypothetical protein
MFSEPVTDLCTGNPIDRELCTPAATAPEVKWGQRVSWSMSSMSRVVAMIAASRHGP